MSDLTLFSLDLDRKDGGLKAAKRTTHPDAGGDADDFRAVMAASEVPPCW